MELTFYSTNSEGSGDQINDHSELDLLKVMSRLDKSKREAEKIMRKKRAKKMQKIEEINRRMGHMNLIEAEDFNPFDDPAHPDSRRRRRGLTYLENTELLKYQNRIGIKPRPKPKAKPKIESELALNMRKPIGKPTEKPVIPLPGQKTVKPLGNSHHIPQGTHIQPTIAQPSGHLGSSAYPGVGGHAQDSGFEIVNYPATPGVPAPTQAQPKFSYQEAQPKSKSKKGLGRWFGF